MFIIYYLYLSLLHNYIHNIAFLFKNLCPQRLLMNGLDLCFCYECLLISGKSSLSIQVDMILAVIYKIAMFHQGSETRGRGYAGAAYAKASHHFFGNVGGCQGLKNF